MNNFIVLILCYIATIPKMKSKLKIVVIFELDNKLTMVTSCYVLFMIESVSEKKSVWNQILLGLVSISFCTSSECKLFHLNSPIGFHVYVLALTQLNAAPPPGNRARTKVMTKSIGSWCLSAVGDLLIGSTDERVKR